MSSGKMVPVHPAAMPSTSRVTQVSQFSLRGRRNAPVKNSRSSCRHTAATKISAACAPARRRSVVVVENQQHPIPGPPGPEPQPHAARTGPGRYRRVQRQPRHQTVTAPHPVGQQGRLTGPGRAHTRISRRASPCSSASTSRGRGMKPGCGRGTCSLVASRTSRSETATPSRGATGCSATGGLPLNASRDSQRRCWVGTF